MTTAPNPYLPPTGPGYGPGSVPGYGPGTVPGTVPGTAVEPHLPGEAGVVEPAPSPLLTRAGAELFGTFVLVLVILGTSLYLQVTQLGTVGVAIASGLVLAGLIAGFGHVSGGHFNPAVSLGAALAGKVSFVDMLAYWLAQLIGALLAGLVLFVTVPKGLAELLTQTSGADPNDMFATVANGFGAHSPLSTLSGAQVEFDLKSALILEVVGTAIFVAVILGVVGRRAAVATGPFAIGLTLSVMIMLTAPATNAGLNPARSTAAAIFAGGDALGQLWLFWVAPLVGAAIVGLFAMAFAPVAAVPAPFLEYEDEDEDDEDEDDEDDVEVARP